MAVSSLPSEYGIGCFSREAYEFVDQLEKAGQQGLPFTGFWQLTDFAKIFATVVFPVPLVPQNR